MRPCMAEVGTRPLGSGGNRTWLIPQHREQQEAACQLRQHYRTAKWQQGAASCKRQRIVCHAEQHEDQGKHQGDAAVREDAQPLEASEGKGKSKKDRRLALHKSWSGGLQLFADSWDLLKAQVWPVLMMFAAADSLTFLVHRLCHRTTNQVAMSMLGIHPSAIGNLWWHTGNPAVNNFGTGYQAVVIAMFAVAFPLTLLFRTWATSLATVLLAGHNKEKESLVTPVEASPIVEQARDAAAGPADQLSAQAAAPAAVPVQDEAAASSVAPVQQLLQEPQQPRRGLRAGLQAVRQQWPQVAAVWRRAYWVDFILSLKVLPLQAMCLLVVPIPYALPRIIDMMAANAAVVVEGFEGDSALARSEQLIFPLRGPLVLPFVSLLFLPNIVKPLQAALLAVLPQRYYSELPEIPLAIYVACAALAVVLKRMGDLLPVAAYRHSLQIEQQTRLQTQLT